MAWILTACFAFVWTLCGVSSQSSCRGEGEVLLCRNADESTELRNIGNVTFARLENVRSLPLELEHVPRIKKVEIFKSPNARCSWFSGWINVVVIVNNVRCETAKRQTSSSRPPKSRKPLLVKTTPSSSSSTFPPSSSTFPLPSSTTLMTTSSSVQTSTTSASPPSHNFHSPETLITLRLSELILIIVGSILFTLFLMAFGFNLCLKQQRHVTYCRLFSNCWKEKRSDIKEVKFKNTSFVMGDNDSVASSDVVFELTPIPTHPLRQRISRTPSPARMHID